MPSEDEIRAMKVVELKAELGKLGLPQAGKKDELIDRLLEHFITASAGAGSAAGQSPGNTIAATVPSPAVQAGQGTATAPATGVVSTVSQEEAQRLARAARFGIDPTTSTSTPTPTATTTTADTNKSGGSSFIVDPSLMSEEARQRRIERFGIVEPASKKSKLTTPQKGGSSGPKVSIGGGAVGLEAEKLKERQQRFGVTTSKTLVSQEMEEARRMRAERFGKQN